MNVHAIDCDLPPDCSCLKGDLAMPDGESRERLARWLRALVCDEPEDVWEHVDSGPRAYWYGKAEEALAVIAEEAR